MGTSNFKKLFHYMIWANLGVSGGRRGRGKGDEMNREATSRALMIIVFNIYIIMNMENHK